MSKEVETRATVAPAAQLARLRRRLLPWRLALYAGAAVTIGSPVLGFWGAIVLAFLLLAEAGEWWAGGRLFADIADGRGASLFEAVHVAAAGAGALALALVWFALGPPAALALLAAALATGLLTAFHLPRAAMLRQMIYGVDALILALGDASLAGASPLGGVVLPAALALGATMLLTWEAGRAGGSLRQGAAGAEAARAAAEERARAESRLIATISHELRTPLNGILGMAQTLLQSGLAQEQRKRVEVIAESGRTLNTLLNDLLDFARLDAGRLEINPAEEDLHRSVDHIRQLYAPLAAEKGIAFEVTIAPKTPRWLFFDAVRVRQCLANLVANAIKFTSEGSVTVRVGAEPVGAAGDGRKHWRVTATVTDTGIGIAAEKLQRLFEPFSQADQSIGRHFGGTGLGLAITRQLAEAMGGAVEVQSIAGRGATFRFSFVATEASPPADKTADENGEDALGLAGRRVLIADDVETNRMVMRLFLRAQGVETVEVAGGEEALRTLASANFDAALIDLNMSDLPGAEIARRVRRSEIGHPDLPLIAVTADSASHEVDLGPEGFDSVVRKPIEPRALQSALRRAFARRRAGEGLRPGSASAP